MCLLTIKADPSTAVDGTEAHPAVPPHGPPSCLPPLASLAEPAQATLLHLVCPTACFNVRFSYSKVRSFDTRRSHILAAYPPLAYLRVCLLCPIFGSASSAPSSGLPPLAHLRVCLLPELLILGSASSGPSSSLPPARSAGVVRPRSELPGAAHPGVCLLWPTFTSASCLTELAHVTLLRLVCPRS